MANGVGPPGAVRLAAGGVVLRAFEDGDAAAHAQLIGRGFAHLHPWLPWVTEGHGEEDSRRYLNRPTDDRIFALDVDGRLAGSIGLHDRLGPGAMEIGYWIGADFAGRGHMTTAVALVTDHALGELGLGRIEIHHDRANEASGRIPARLGYRRVAVVQREVTAPGECGEEWQWALAAADWTPRIGPGQTG